MVSSGYHRSERHDSEQTLRGFVFESWRPVKDQGMTPVNKKWVEASTPPKEHQARESSVVRIIKKILLSEYFILYLTILCFFILWIIIPNIATPYNLGNILANLGPLLPVAIGQTFVLIVGGIDLSQISI